MYCAYIGIPLKDCKDMWNVYWRFRRFRRIVECGVRGWLSRQDRRMVGLYFSLGMRVDRSRLVFGGSLIFFFFFFP